MAQKLSHAFSLGYALRFGAYLHQLCRYVDMAREQGEALITLCTEHGFPQWVATGTIVAGWALAAQERVKEGIAKIQQGMAAYQATGAGVTRLYDCALLAEASGKGGQVEEGLTVLAAALTGVNSKGNRFYEAELYRLKGQLTLQKFQASSSKFQASNPQAEAEAAACFHKAIEIARRQSAKSLELRAVMSLSRLWQQQGKKDEARRILAEIYGWFTEGFDTADLQEAKALLESLESGV
jgi:predicted ATPase